jgi:hypothetical protein
MQEKQKINFNNMATDTALSSSCLFCLCCREKPFPKAGFETGLRSSTSRWPSRFFPSERGECGRRWVETRGEGQPDLTWPVFVAWSDPPPSSFHRPPHPAHRRSGRGKWSRPNKISRQLRGGRGAASRPAAHAQLLFFRQLDCVCCVCTSLL